MIEIDTDLINISLDILIKKINNVKKKYNFSTELTNAEEKNACRNILINEQNSFAIIKYTGIIEWAPVKLCQSVFYMVKYNDEFWTIKYNKLYGFMAKYYINMYNILSTTISSNNNTLSRSNIIWPIFDDIYKSLNEIIYNRTKYVRVSTIYNNMNNKKYIHYMILYDNIIYYIVYTDNQSLFIVYPYY